MPKDRSVPRTGEQMTEELRLSDLCFVTSIYGTNYLPFLAPHLYSVSRCHPEAIELVLWQDIPTHEIDLLSYAFPHCRFVAIEDTIEGDLNQRLAKKVDCWQAACKLYPDNPLCFIDCDALLVKPIGGFLTANVDVLYTWKDEPFPLNLGVLLVRDGRTGQPVLEEWGARTKRIVTDRNALSKALALSGDASQHAFREMIGFVNYDNLVGRSIRGRNIVFKGVPCRLLNETNSVPITDDTHIIHYKAGWHPILLDGADFSEYRAERASSEMYDFWVKTAAQANAHVAREFVTRACRAHVKTFSQVLGPYEERGILHSEMLAVCAVCDELNVDVIIESGRCRGQSTLMLARYFSGRTTRIISVDLDRDENAVGAEERLAPYDSVELLYGDSRARIPKLVQRFGGERCALLLDGPKGEAAVSLVKEALGKSGSVVVTFFHDARPPSPIRDIVQSLFARVYLTDDEEYVETYSFLDDLCKPKPGVPITTHSWRPYMKGDDPIQSYGPTLAIVFPRLREVVENRESETQGSKGWAGLVKAFISLTRHEGPRAALKRALEWAARKL